MPDNKNQHFVPQSYLRRFAVDDRRKSIDLHNIAARRLVANASIKGQCSKNYFYGSEDKVEAGIQKLEVLGADAIAKAAEFDETVDMNSLLLFSLFQTIRTEGFLKGQMAHWKEMRDAIYEDAADDPSLYVPDSPAEASKNAFSSLRKMLASAEDLRCCILQAAPKTSFLTSDNPSYWINRFLAQKKLGQMAGYGINSAGFCILLPLSPSALFLAFDDNVYRCLGPDKKFGVLSKQDVDWVNVATASNAFKNLYFDRSFSPEQISKVARESDKLRLPETYRIHLLKRNDARSRGEEGVYERVGIEGFRKPGKSLIVSERLHVTYKSWPDFLRLRLRPKFINTGTGAGKVRFSYQGE